MATDLQRLIVSLEAKTAAFEKSMNKALGVANSRSRAIETRFAKMNAQLGNSLAGVGKRWIAGLAAGVTVSAIAKFSDSATKIDNALKVAGLSGEELEKTYESLRESAVRNAAPLEDLVTLYSRASMAAQNLGANQDELRKFTDNVALALRVSGKSAQESSGALLQLSQVLGGSVVQAQEYNSLIDGAYPLLQAVAAGLKQAGGDVSKLTQLVKAGEVPTRAFFDAFQSGSAILERKVQGATLTLSQAMENIRTAFTNAAREFNRATSASERAAKGINNLADAISRFDISGFIGDIVDAYEAMDRLADSFGNNAFFQWLSGGTPGKVIDLQTEEAKAEAAALEAEVKLLQERIALNTELGFDNTDALARLAEVSNALASLRSQLSGMATTMNGMSERGYVLGTPGDPNALAQKDTTGKKKVKEVDLNDYELPSKKGKKSKQSEYAREIEQIKERTAALQAETEAMAGINPLIDDYGYAVEYAAAKQELLNAAKKAGLEITPALAANIDTLASAYAKASAESAKLAEEQDNLRELAEDFNGLAKDVLSGFIQDLKDGKTATEALGNALSKIADKLLDIALSSIFSGSGGIGGFFAKIFGGFAEGGYTGAGGKHQPAGVVHKGEYVFSKKATRKIGVGNLEAMHKGAKGYAVGGFVGPAAPRFAGPQAAQGGSDVRVTVGVTADNNGNLMPFVQSVAQSTVRRAAPAIVQSSVQRSTQAVRNGLPGMLADTQARTL